MKDHIIQILLSIVLSAVALFLGILFSVETPIKTTENFTLLWVSLLNALWFIPYVFYYRKKKRIRNAILSTVIFGLFTLPFLVLRLYTPKFDSEKWRSSINENRTYGGTPAYSHGEMVEDLIDSKKQE